MAAQKILVLRPDRIGDVILSTPVLSAIQAKLPDTEIHFLVRSDVAPLLRGLPQISKLIEWEPGGKHHGWKGFLSLVKELHQQKYDIALSLQSHPRLALALWWCGIPRRIAPRGKIHTYLYANEGLRQRRSRVQMHEAEYNLELLKCLKIEIEKDEFETQVAIDPRKIERARDFLESKGWKEDAPLVTLHPGMGGSALNWPIGRYTELALKLINADIPVLITGGPSDRILVDQIHNGVEVARTQYQAALIKFTGSEEEGIDFLAGLFTLSSAVVAPSTGPLHLAVALGKYTVSFFSPIRVQSAKRWGPYLKDRERARVLIPDVKCKKVFRCSGEKCQDAGCMDRISVQNAFDLIREGVEEGV